MTSDETPGDRLSYPKHGLTEPIHLLSNVSPPVPKAAKTQIRLQLTLECGL
jgi:hypothetical protein